MHHHNSKFAQGPMEVEKDQQERCDVTRTATHTIFSTDNVILRPVEAVDQFTVFESKTYFNTRTGRNSTYLVHVA